MSPKGDLIYGIPEQHKKDYLAYIISVKSADKLIWKRRTAHNTYKKEPPVGSKQILESRHAVNDYRAINMHAEHPLKIYLKLVKLTYVEYGP